MFYKVLMGFRPTIPADMAVGFRNVMEACWQPNDAARPTFDVILRCLQVSVPLLLSQLSLTRLCKDHTVWCCKVAAKKANMCFATLVCVGVSPSFPLRPRIEGKRGGRK